MAKRGDSGITRAVQKKYLDLVEQTGLKERSAQMVGFSPSAMLRFRQDHPEFDDEVSERMELYRDLLRAELHRRAVEGVEVPVFGKGGQIGTKREFSDRLLELHIKRHDPAYRDKQTVDHNVKGGVLLIPGLAANSKQWEEEEDG